MATELTFKIGIVTMLRRPFVNVLERGIMSGRAEHSRAIVLVGDFLKLARMTHKTLHRQTRLQTLGQTATVRGLEGGLTTRFCACRYSGESK